MELAHEIPCFKSQEGLSGYSKSLPSLKRRLIYITLWEQLWEAASGA